MAQKLVVPDGSQYIMLSFNYISTECIQYQSTTASTSRPVCMPSGLKGFVDHQKCRSFVGSSIQWLARWTLEDGVPSLKPSRVGCSCTVLPSRVQKAGCRRVNAHIRPSFNAHGHADWRNASFSFSFFLLCATTCKQFEPHACFHACHTSHAEDIETYQMSAHDSFSQPSLSFAVGNMMVCLPSLMISSPLASWLFPDRIAVVMSILGVSHSTLGLLQIIRFLPRSRGWDIHG